MRMLMLMLLLVPTLRAEMLKLMSRAEGLHSQLVSEEPYDVLSPLPDGRASMLFLQNEIRKAPVSTFLAVNGQGWFRVLDGKRRLLTRDGRFRTGSDGVLADPEGRPVLGFALDSLGNVASKELCRMKLKRGAYVSYHFDETGKFYGETPSTDPVTGQLVTGSAPIWQVALFQVPDPGAMVWAGGTRFLPSVASVGLAGEGAMGAICPGSLEHRSKPALPLEHRLVGDFCAVLRGSWPWSADVRSDLAAAVRRNPALLRACLENLENQLTPGYRPWGVLKALGGRGLQRVAGAGVVVPTLGVHDLALDGPGYFELEGGRRTRDGRFRPTPHGVRSHDGHYLLGWRAGTRSRVLIPSDASSFEYTATGELYWTRLRGDGKPELGYRLGLGGARLVQGALELPPIDLYEQRVVADTLLHLAGLKLTRGSQL